MKKPPVIGLKKEDAEEIEAMAERIEIATGKAPDRMVISKGLYKHLFGQFPVKVTHYNGMRVVVK